MDACKIHVAVVYNDSPFESRGDFIIHLTN
jgi:hypothetical protein